MNHADTAAMRLAALAADVVAVANDPVSDAEIDFATRAWMFGLGMPGMRDNVCHTIARRARVGIAFCRCCNAPDGARRHVDGCPRAA